jgi:hypothetical protein
MEPSRHPRIEMTKKKHVGKNAETMAEDIWCLDVTYPEEPPRNAANSSMTVVRGGLEPPTPGFSVQCSTN